MTDTRAESFDALLRRERERERLETENRRLAAERKKIERDGPKLKGARLEARGDTFNNMGWVFAYDPVTEWRTIPG